MLRLLIVDDHPLYRTGLRITLARTLQDLQVAEAEGASEALADLQSHPGTDLVLIDVHLAGTDGFTLLRQLGDQNPQVARMLISGDEDPELAHRARRLGASGFLSKSAPMESFLHAVRTVLDGGVWFVQAKDTLSPALQATPAGRTEGPPPLTLRQMEVLWLMAEGQSNKAIARALHITERTVKAHLGAVFVFLEARSRTHALVEAGRRGLLVDRA